MNVQKFDLVNIFFLVIPLQYLQENFLNFNQEVNYD